MRPVVKLVDGRYHVWIVRDEPTMVCEADAEYLKACFNSLYPKEF